MFVLLDWIDLQNKFHKSPGPYPTMHYFVTEMCTCVHISVTKWCNVGCLSDASWDIWDRSIDHKSPLVQVMAWCQKDTSHCLNQWWPSLIMSTCGTRAQWVNDWFVYILTHWDLNKYERSLHVILTCDIWFESIFTWGRKAISFAFRDFHTK